MERFTSRTPAGVANLDYPQNCFYPDGTKDQVALSAYRQKAIDRLAAYEDTGLEPEEIAALAQAEQDGRLVVLPSNDPLTIEELRNMKGQPVYLKTLGEDFDDGWYIVGGIDKVRLHCLYLYSLLWLEHYGKTWLAYRRKPEKGEDNA